MLILANVMYAIAEVLNALIGVLMIAVILQALMSWLNPNHQNQFYRVVVAITDPVLTPIRRRLPIVGGVDLSPIVLLLALLFLKHALVQSLLDYSVQIRMSILPLG